MATAEIQMEKVANYLKRGLLTIREADQRMSEIIGHELGYMAAKEIDRRIDYERAMFRKKYRLLMEATK